MVDRRDVGSWLEGPRFSDVDEDYVPGRRLGLPAGGPGSVAGMGRRVLGIAVDWALCLVIAQVLIGDVALGPLVVLAVEHAMLVGTIGASVGHLVAGLRVRTVQGGAPGPLRALGRALLLVLAVPALVWDRDQRGLHDKAVGTVVVRH